MKEYVSVTKAIDTGTIACAVTALTYNPNSLETCGYIKKLDYSVKGRVGTEPILSTMYEITDFYISEQNTIYAIDIAGHLYCSKPILDNRSPQKEEFYEGAVFDWSHTYISDDVLSAITGEDDEIWVATFKGDLIHIKNGTLSVINVANSSMRLVRLSKNHYFFMSYQQMFEFTNNQWQKVFVAPDDNISDAFTDICIFRDEIYGVNNLGQILKRDAENVFQLVGTINASIFGCDVFDDKLHLACGEQGVLTWDDTLLEAKEEKKYGQPVGVYAGAGNCYFPLADRDDAVLLVKKKVTGHAWHTNKV